MSNILIIIKDGILSEVRSDGLDDKFMIADYDSEPELDISDVKPFRADKKLTEEEINFFKNY